MAGYLEDLERLGRLREQKVLSDEEFDAEKARILAAQQQSDERPVPFALFDSRRAKLAAGALGVLGVAGAAIYLGVSSGSSAPADSSPSAAPAQAPRAAPSEVRLTSLLKFDVPSECGPGEDLKLLVDDLRSLDPGKRAVLTLPAGRETVRPLVQSTPLKDGATAIISELAAPGALEGLKVVGLRTSRFEGADMYTLQVRFNEPPEKVRRVLNERGFDLPKIGELRSAELDEGALMLGVEGIDGGSALTCARV